ncbi:hypothetical protein TNCV_55741 [Trichonephila clavipes]|nr:hypothetical protein TNCV_55741 [Trichonephila clavipes]
MFSWFSIQHNARSFEFPKSGCRLVSLETDRRTQKRIDWEFAFICPQKQHLGGKLFADDGDIQHEVLLRMTQQSKEFYAAGIVALIKRCGKSIIVAGYYVEK